jgi:hypothetical protein
MREALGIIALSSEDIMPQNRIFDARSPQLCNRSSFITKYLKGRRDRLRRKCYTFCCYPIANPRRRVLLEAYAIRRLCPAHIGHGAGGALLKPK